MRYQSTISSTPASVYGPTLLTICTATSFYNFANNLDSKINQNDVISGYKQRITPIQKPDLIYDAIVIGGGAGGAVVASRLSENPKWEVLLVEAGADEPSASGLPGLGGKFLHEDYSWNYRTTDEPAACRRWNGSCPCTSGKVLGGNTVHNQMIYLRGIPKDFDNWVELGNEGWSWEEVEPFYKKLEYNGELDRVGRKHHGTEGLLSVERFPHVAPIGLSMLEAADELGFGVSDDLNGDQYSGFSWTQSTNKKGVRSSAAAAFLRPARDRKNLHILLESQVTRVLIENKRAVGIEYVKNGKSKKVYARKEVIISGGAMNSPQILLLSGIGPKEHLESVGVPVVLDLPGVGENFHDHPGIPVYFKINATDVYDNNDDVAAQYLKDQTGPMSSTGTMAIVGVIATNMTEPDFPDMQIFFVGYVARCGTGVVNALQSDGEREVFMVASHVHPRSKGTVRLASNDPLDYPILRANYQEHPDDLEAQVQGLEMLLALTKSKALESYDFKMVPVEACSQHELESRDYLACLTKYDFHTMYHFAGSCKMGPASDPLAVVDPQLRVHGIKGLRVADASIMPEVITTNTQAPAYMIGERAADFIKKDYAKRSSTKRLLSARN